MKTLSVRVDDATWSAAAQVAAAQHTTLGAMVAGFVKQVAAQEPELDEAEDARQRAELVKALAECRLDLSEKPSREKTYSDRRFHRH
jgi:antitoxin component of RelBE/YafQ-DinJ toxin-antitoxin module